MKAGDKVIVRPNAAAGNFAPSHHLDPNKVYTIAGLEGQYSVFLVETSQGGYSIDRFQPVTDWIERLRSLGYTVEPPKVTFTDLPVGTKFKWPNFDYRLFKISDNEIVLETNVIQVSPTALTNTVEVLS